MIIDPLKDYIGSFNQANYGDDMGGGYLFNAIIIASGTLHVLYEEPGEPVHYPLQSEPIELIIRICEEPFKSKINKIIEEKNNLIRGKN